MTYPSQGNDPQGYYPDPHRSSDPYGQPAGTGASPYGDLEQQPGINEPYTSNEHVVDSQSVYDREQPAYRADDNGELLNRDPNATQGYAATDYAEQDRGYVAGQTGYVGQAGYGSGASAAGASTAYVAGDAGASAVEPVRDERSIGDMISDLTQKFSLLLQQEVALAKAEATQEAKKAGKGAGMLAGAGLAGFFTLLFLSLGLWWAIAIWIGNHDHPALGWSGLIMMVLWGIIAGVLAMLGRNELQRVRALPETTDSVSKIPNAVKGEEEKNR